MGFTGFKYGQEEPEFNGDHTDGGTFVTLFEDGEVIYSNYRAPRDNPRTLSEILIDADNALFQTELQMYCEELFDNKKKYPLIQISFAEEHFEMLYDKFKTIDI